IISWGLAPTEPLRLEKESPEKLMEQLLGYWEVISRNSGIKVAQIAENALLAPAKCCVKSFDFNSSSTGQCQTVAPPGRTAEQESVEKAYAYLRLISAMLKEKFNFS
ncbi:hypothetical protein ACFLWN_03765, partial [Chloroflexota bacterium]